MKQYILLIDDDRDEVTFFREALNKVWGGQNFECIYAGNAMEAFDIFKIIIPKYIFVDFDIPQINGPGLLCHIKEDAHLRNTKIYLHSMKISSEMYQRAILAGASGCIKKVYSIEELVNELIPVLMTQPKPVSRFLNGKHSIW